MAWQDLRTQVSEVFAELYEREEFSDRRAAVVERWAQLKRARVYAAIERYRSSAKGIATVRRYRKSAQAKSVRRKHDRTGKAKATRAAYWLKNGDRLRALRRDSDRIRHAEKRHRDKRV